LPGKARPKIGQYKMMDYLVQCHHLDQSLWPTDWESSLSLFAFAGSCEIIVSCAYLQVQSPNSFSHHLSVVRHLKYFLLTILVLPVEMLLQFVKSHHPL
jgi:hypothetical protein